MTKGRRPLCPEGRLVGRRASTPVCDARRTFGLPGRLVPSRRPGRLGGSAPIATLDRVPPVPWYSCVVRGRRTSASLALAAGLAVARFAEATEPVCIPLPADYRVTLEVRDGSLLSLVEALACLLGVRVIRASTIRDAPVTVTTPHPLPLALAVSESDRAASSVGLRLKRDRKAVRVECRRPRSCGSSSASGRPVRVIFRAPQRQAVLTTEVRAPSRAVLEDPKAIRSLGQHYVIVREDVRTLAQEDPMAFVSEGAAWPNLLGLPEPGFFITWLRPDGFFERLGLRVGDLVTEVNGYRLRTIADAFAAYGALQDARILIVRVRRGAETLVLVVEFRSPDVMDPGGESVDRIGTLSSEWDLIHASTSWPG